MTIVDKGRDEGEETREEETREEETREERR
jgi:hypothetical protein